MDIGSFTIIAAFMAVLVSLVGYLAAARNEDIKEVKGKKEEKPSFFLDLARLSYYITTISITIASVYLYHLILTHQFQIKYVYQYSSSDLSFGLLLSTFWAGQEGSFLFWTLLIALFGLLFLKKSGTYEAKSMVFLNLILAFFLAILLKASPFVTMTNVPTEGAGLNPLLQNFWMIIHPPILFIGYAAIAIPFSLALAALWKKDYNGWLNQALPWTIFTALTLGAGIIIGAFWAYETLGWGGYWGWDPVENSSLIPWLTLLALVHGIVVQRRNQSLAKTNFMFAILSFVLVLYATFLTRSGVLEDFSVHSFQNLGISNYLIIFMIVMLGIGLIFFFKRLKDIPLKPMDLNTLNRENGLFGAMIVLAASAFLTFLGTSSPIITGLMGSPSQVDISFYDKVNLPVGIVMAILLGITPFLLWIEKDLKSLPRRLAAPAFLAVVFTIFTVIMGDLGIGEIIFVLASYFALFANIIVLYRQWKISWRNIAGPISHFGVALAFISIIISGNYSVEQRIVLDKDKTEEIMGHQVTYKGIKPKADGKNVLEIQVEGSGVSYTATPRLFNTKNNEVMREPHVKSGFINDIYISPLEHRAGGNHAHGGSLTLVKGETKDYKGMQITFNTFQMKPHDDGSSFNVGAVLNVKDGDHAHTVVPILTMGSQGRTSQPAVIPTHGKYAKEVKVLLKGMDADKKMIELDILGLGDEKIVADQIGEQLMIEFSTKPFMSILWFGTILLIAGSIIALTQRINVAK